MTPSVPVDADPTPQPAPEHPAPGQPTPATDAVPSATGAAQDRSEAVRGGFDMVSPGSNVAPDGADAAQGDPHAGQRGAGAVPDDSRVVRGGTDAAQGGAHDVRDVGDAASIGGNTGGTVGGGRGAGGEGDGDGSAGGGAAGGGEGRGFSVRLDNFEGPFDLLLQLISKHKLDVTEVALSRVTDEFIVHIRAMGADWDLDEASEFLIIAATLLDLKAARLLPAAEVEDEEDLALLEARDLLFARLLQYKAFKEAAAHLSRLEASAARRWPRSVGLEPRYAEALPEIILGIGLDRFARLAVRAMTPKAPKVLYTDHVHLVRVSVAEHAVIIAERLQRLGTASFRTLCGDCANTLEMVARFLALLEMYRENLVGFEQLEALGELTVRWTGGERSGDIAVDEYIGVTDAAGPLAATPSNTGTTEERPT